MGHKKKVLKCDACGKLYRLSIKDYNRKLKGAGKTFCSQECYRAHRRVIGSRVSVPIWCSHCGKGYIKRVLKSKVDDGGKHYCSSTCSYASRSGSGNSMFGVEPWNKGKPLPDNVRAIISAGNKRAFEDPNIHAKYCGEHNGFWKGGICKTSYPPEFNRTVRRVVKERDGYKCRICGIDSLHPHVHHIDYNKQNSEMLNLITLCNSCHSKTNSNRGYWKIYLSAIVEEPLLPIWVLPVRGEHTNKKFKTAPTYHSTHNFICKCYRRLKCKP